MDLCISGSISNILTQTHTSSFIYIYRFTNPGYTYLHNSSLRTSSEETSTRSSQYFVGEPVTRNWRQQVVKNSNVGSETSEEEESTEDTPTDEQTQAFEFLDKLDVKLDSEDTPSVLLLGGGSVIAVWIATVLVGAIDSIPLFPKLMEVVGLAYTLWFGTRYLLLKKNREELIVKIEEIKQQVLGSNEDD